MPKSKKDDTESSEYESDTDSGPDDKEPPPPKKKLKGETTKAADKKSKSEPAKAADKKSESEPAKAAATSKSDSAKGPWTLEGLRQVSISEFRGRKSVDIREFYNKNGDILPGKKGICLSAKQWLRLLEVADEVTAAVQDQ